MDGSSNTGPSGSGEDQGETAAHRVRLPSFLVPEPVGLGQVVKRVTKSMGVKPCTPCEQRAQRMDRWMRIEPRR